MVGLNEPIKNQNSRSSKLKLEPDWSKTRRKKYLDQTGSNFNFDFPDFFLIGSLGPTLRSLGFNGEERNAVFI